MAIGPASVHYETKQRSLYSNGNVLQRQHSNSVNVSKLQSSYCLILGDLAARKNSFRGIARKPQILTY